MKIAVSANIIKLDFNPEKFWNSIVEKPKEGK